MKIKIAAIIILSAIVLSACGGVTPYPTPITVSPTLNLPTTTPLPSATSLPIATSTLWYTPTLETLNEYPTPEAAVLPTCEPTGDCLIMTPNVQRQDINFHELYIGKYVLRSWCNVDSQDDACLYSAITIASKDGPIIDIGGYPAWLGTETGADLTNSEKPDIVIYVGNGNCCVEAQVYEAAGTLRKIMDVWSQDPGSFEDLNGDGSYEYIAPTRFWSPSFNFNCQAHTIVVYEYDKKIGYIPATNKFKTILQQAIQQDFEALSSFMAQNPNAKLSVCDVYELEADYLLTGQTEQARNILNKYFSPNDASNYMTGIQKDLQPYLAP